MMRIIRAAALVGLAQAGAVVSEKQAPGAGDALEGASGRVGQLVTLIEKLKADFNAEYQEAQTAYDAQSCAHEDTMKSSIKSRDEAAAAIKELDTAIKKNSADIAALAATVKINEGDIAAKNKEIADAISQRAKEHEAYGVEVKEFNDAIKSAQLAYEVLTSADKASMKTTQSLLAVRSSSVEQKNLWRAIKGNLESLPLNGKLMTVDKIEELHEFVDDRLNKLGSGSEESQTSLLQFGPASQRVTGILKDMRGQFVAKLQGAQQSEQEAAASHAAFVKKSRALVKAMVDSMEGRKAELDAAKADKEANLNEKNAKKKEQKEMDTLWRETKAAQEALAKEWAEASASHNDEINGVNKALEYLQSQQNIPAGSDAGSTPQLLLSKAKTSVVNTPKKFSRQALIQLASKARKPLYNNMFQKIVWAIEDMMKTHQASLADNKDQSEQCKTMQSEANSVAARKKAALQALDRKISELKAEAASTLASKVKLEGEKKDTEDEMAASQTAWEKSDASRTLEISQLTESVRLITGATQALSESGSERMGDVIGILNMLKTECQTGVQELTKAKSSEAAAWTESKTAMANLILSLEDDIAKHEQKITSLTKKEVEAGEKKRSVAAEEPMDTNACQAFLMEFQGKQDALNQKIQDLTSAKAHLAGWKNMSADAEHFDSSKTDYAAPP